MFKLSEIKELIKMVDETSVQELEIENEGSRICIRKQTAHQGFVAMPEAAYQQQTPQQQTIQPEQTAAPSVHVDTEDLNLHTIASPMVGTFYASPSPSAPAFAKKGDKVNEKTVVCIIEAMKLMNEIEAEVKGEIVDILVDNGQLVEFGQPLFLVKNS